MNTETSVFRVGREPSYQGMNYGDLVFRKKTTKNMDMLWRKFYATQDFPEFYLGRAQKMALCICPETNQEEWHNANSLLMEGEPKKGARLTAFATIEKKQYSKETIFQRWETAAFYEWKMQSGNVMQLRQDFIDGLVPEDKRRLGMTK